jgi:hypothetical protein
MHLSPILCLDFGSAFTKVGLRLRPDDPSDLLTEETLNFDEDRCCIPSVVAANLPGKATPWLCGVAAVDLKEEHGFRVFRNWKPQLFAPPPEGGPADKVTAFLGRLDELGRRERLLAELAARHGLEAAAVRALAEAHGMSLEELQQAAERWGGPRPLRDGAQTQPPTPPGPTIHPEVREAALQYFTWLRAFIGRVCRRQGVEKLRAVKTRLCIPAFAAQAGAREDLVELLREAGWTMHEHRPILPEPLANAIGVMTGGKNRRRLVNGRMVIDLAAMFGDGGFLRTLTGKQDQAGILAIDVGAFTTDFTLIEVGAAAGPDRCRIHTRSEPGGVAALDRRVMSCLAPDQVEAIAGLSFRHQEAFRQAVYVRNKPYKPSASEVIGPLELDRIQEEMRRFAAELAGLLFEFLRSVPISVHDLILTGGGNNIPAVRDQLLERLQGLDVPKVHLPDPGARHALPGRHILDQRLVRGGSAIGGTSIFFDADLG